MHSHPIPLSKYILDFELLSILVFPLLLISTRVAEEFTVLAKLWGGAIALAIGLQVFAMAVRTYTYPMNFVGNTRRSPERCCRRQQRVPGQ